MAEEGADQPILENRGLKSEGEDALIEAGETLGQDGAAAEGEAIVTVEGEAAIEDVAADESTEPGVIVNEGGGETPPALDADAVEEAEATEAAATEAAAAEAAAAEAATLEAAAVAEPAAVELAGGEAEPTEIESARAVADSLDDLEADSLMAREAVAEERTPPAVLPATADFDDGDDFEGATLDEGTSLNAIAPLALGAASPLVANDAADDLAVEGEVGMQAERAVAAAQLPPPRVAAASALEAAVGEDEDEAARAATRVQAAMRGKAVRQNKRRDAAFRSPAPGSRPPPVSATAASMAAGSAATWGAASPVDSVPGFCSEAEYEQRMSKIRRLKREAEERRQREAEQRCLPRSEP